MEIPEKYKKKFTKEEINELPLQQYEGEIKLIDRDEDVAAAMREIGSDSILGFDTETRPAFRKGTSYNPSLIQLATAEKVYLLHLSHITLCDEIKEILSASDIIKTGVAVGNDVKELRALSPFSPGGFYDLGDRAREMGMQTSGLRNLAANLLGFRISKGVQCSNWGRKALTSQQIIYAATDAWISRKIYMEFLRLGFI